MACVAISVSSEISFSGGNEVVRIEYELGRLAIHLRAMQGGKEAVVWFAAVEGFRVLDERDLMEYRPTCSTQNGWLFEIQEGGWLTQEVVRPGSLIGFSNRGLHEYLVTGTDDCVTVLSVVPPDILVKTAQAVPSAK